MEEKIINLYLSGYGSTTIVKMLSVPKRKVLKILNDNNLIDKNENAKYKEFKFDGSNWYSFYTCSVCNKDVMCYASTKYYLARNLNKKNKCKKCSLNLQKGVNNPFYNKTHTQESIDKISKNKLGVSTSDHMSKPKYRLMFSKMKKDLWASGKMEQIRIKMSNLMKQRIANGELKSYNRSKAEDEIIEILHGLNIKCQPNYIIESKIFDIYIPKYNLLVEYNGDYWHCNPNKYTYDYINKKKNMTAKDIWEQDKNKLYLAEKNGYACEIIWESDYKKNKNVILEIINRYEQK
jgi:G:T-mismatch repair DNA endonuclease (very short patch repair protein)